MIARADDNTMDGKRVLFISSYSYAWDTVQIQIEGIKDGLGADVVLDYEFMDTKRVSDETAEQLFYEGLQYRMEHVAPYDVVILGDDAALLFALEYQEELFAEIPLVFEGVNDEKLAVTAAQDPMITGVLEKLSVEKNIDLGLQLIPKASKVVAILDDTITGQAERERFYSVADKYPQLAFAEINTSDLSSSNLKRELRNVSEDTILIYVVMTEDADGKQYTNKESVQLIAKEASVPAIRMVEGGIGEGLLGGNVVSMHQSGKLAADIAMQVLNGRSISEIDVIMESPNIYCLDEEVMRKFDLDLALIPEGATIVNSKEDFFERNREVLVPGGILLIAMLVILLVMGYDNFRRRKLMQELQKAKLIMESASKHDFLTGLSNRSKFMEDLEQLVREDKQCTVMMIDIDDFKTINDSYGHTAGDEALKQVANRLIEMQSPILTAYRFAGDEFIILLRSGQSKIIEKTAFSCRQIFSKMFYLDGHKHKVCGSIGVASFPKDADNLEQLIVCADDAMYQVKKSGKNDFAIYQPEFSKGKTEEKDT
ncbi:MAG: diguanylate cyclase [Lachnospiraceae bacterium]|nr:diguanylate cyclase [Lachnospiraceae bacterium]